MTTEEIRRRFEFSTDFNEIFDAFQEAVNQRLTDIELYRLLFWNHSLSPEELCLFGEKLAKEIPEHAYDTFLWLGSVFEVTYSTVDNHELTLTYYKKAADIRPDSPDPYLLAADCYEPDLNIPPISQLIEFLKQGAGQVPKPVKLYERLSNFFEILGNDEMQVFYRRKAEEGSSTPDQGIAP